MSTSGTGELTAIMFTDVVGYTDLMKDYSYSVLFTYYCQPPCIISSFAEISFLSLTFYDSGECG